MHDTHARPMHARLSPKLVCISTAQRAKSRCTPVRAHRAALITSEAVLARRCETVATPSCNALQACAGVVHLERRSCDPQRRSIAAARACRLDVRATGLGNVGGSGKGSSGREGALHWLLYDMAARTGATGRVWGECGGEGRRRGAVPAGKGPTLKLPQALEGPHGLQDVCAIDCTAEGYGVPPEEVAVLVDVLWARHHDGFSCSVPLHRQTVITVTQYHPEPH